MNTGRYQKVDSGDVQGVRRPESHAGDAPEMTWAGCHPEAAQEMTDPEFHRFSPTTCPSNPQAGSIAIPRCASAVTGMSMMLGGAAVPPTWAPGPLAR